ncbi:MAG: phosphate ABC transporter permease PstA [Defluviitaleaceae bacterium]|nr:phosphate ABC transporter permease PstA [Defluviitaleaceae bacterium]
MRRKLYDAVFYLLTGLCALLSVNMLYHLMRFLLSNGLPLLYRQLSGLEQTAILEPTKLQQMIFSTLFLTGVTLFFVLPFAISAAIYLHEYARENVLAQMTRFSVQTLASIPSIVYGLFGMLIFVQLAGFGMSILAGSGTLSLMLLPIVMTQTENTLRQIPHAYREASASLGATPFETIKKIILPQVTPGVLVGMLLAVGRIMSESAALLFTLGTFVRMPVNRQTGMFSVLEAGTTLTIRALIEFKEHGNLEAAAAIGVITVGVVIILNVISKGIVWIFEKN